MQEVSGSIPLGSTIVRLICRAAYLHAIDLDHSKAYFSRADRLFGHSSARPADGASQMTALSHIVRSASLSAAALALMSALPAQAQFGGISLGSLGKKSSPTDTTTTNGCPEGKKKSVGASIFGSMAGSMANRVGGRFASFVPLPEFATVLTNAIACKLDQKEQKQAADATLAVTRGDATTGAIAVGQTAEWTSGSRKDVTGKSTIVAVETAPGNAGGNGSGKGKGGGKANGGGKGPQLASAAQCITVSDVVIVNGEETTANKHMCRAPGAARYTLMA